jgi:hypothetical protein
MVWYQHKKDVNYYMRLKLVGVIKAHVDETFQFNSPVNFDPPLPYTYSGGKVSMISIERFKYMSQFKREFTVIRILLDNGEHIPLAKLRLKHLLKISKLFSK